MWILAYPDQMINLRHAHSIQMGEDGIRDGLWSIWVAMGDRLYVVCQGEHEHVNNQFQTLRIALVAHPPMFGTREWRREEPEPDLPEPLF